MEKIISLSNIAISLVCTIVFTLVWKVVKWIWLKPKILERRLIEQGFHGRSYKVLHGDTKEMAQMVKETNSKPMNLTFSNDYSRRIFPFHHQIIKNYGEKSYIWDGPIPTVNITNPEDIRDILMKNCDFQFAIPNPLIRRLSNGLLRLEGQRWARERKLINLVFHMDKLKHMVPAFHVSCNEMIQEWEKVTTKTGSSEVDIWSSLHNFSADAISRAAFGSSYQDGKRVFELLREHIWMFLQARQSAYIPGSRFFPTKTNRREAKIYNETKSLLKDMILRRLKAMEDGEAAKDDLLGLMLKSYLEGITLDNRHDNYSNQQPFRLSFKDVIEECKMFYIAGQETTSSLLVWTLILLSKHQNWQEQVREEIFATFGHNTPHNDGLNQLKKMSMVLQEVLRLYSPVPFLTRKVCKDMKVGDAILPAGVQVILLLVMVHHNEKIWGEDAKEFNPERFSQGILKAAGGNMCSFAFSWGPRICIGSNFAMVQVKTALSMILQRFSLELSPSYVHAPSMTRGSLRPQFGANLILSRI